MILDDGPIAGGETSEPRPISRARSTTALRAREAARRARGAARRAEPQRCDRRDRTHRGGDRRGCDFERVDGYLFGPPGESADLPKTSSRPRSAPGLASNGLQRPDHGLRHGPALRFARQAQFHPLRIRRGRAIDRGVRRAARSRARAAEFHGGSEARVKTAGGTRSRREPSLSRRTHPQTTAWRSTPSRRPTARTCGTARAARSRDARALLGYRRSLPLRGACSRLTAIPSC